MDLLQNHNLVAYFRESSSSIRISYPTRMNQTSLRLELVLRDLDSILILEIHLQRQVHPLQIFLEAPRFRSAGQVLVLPSLLGNDNGLSSDSSPPKTPPRKVLDAPSLQDDFYWNVADWRSSQNVLAVGLGTCVYLWTASNSKVMKLFDLGPNDSVALLLCQSLFYLTTPFFPSSPVGFKDHAKSSVLLWVSKVTPRVSGKKA
ncbi:The WD repeat Cdc20/Fizzy family protein [Raphanus sativus]|nr:The WD repeat Cdc20/Fizzy family protein [Raphanus sativus]